MDARRREGRLDQSARRGRPAASLLSRAHRRRGLGGRGGDRPHRPRALPLRRRAALFHLSWRGERRRLRAARRQAARAGALFPVPALLSPRPRQPERGRDGTGRCGAPTRSGSASAAIPAWPRLSRRGRRACGGGPTSGCASEAFEAEMLADEAFAIRAERLLARIDNPKRQEEELWR